MTETQDNSEPEEAGQDNEDSRKRVIAHALDELPGAALMELAGRLFLREAKELTAEMEALLKHDIAKVILDMSHVEYMNSSAIASLATCAAGAKGYGGNVVLMALTPTIRNVLDTLGLLGLFLTADTQEEAIKALS